MIRGAIRGAVKRANKREPIRAPRLGLSAFPFTKADRLERRVNLRVALGDALDFLKNHANDIASMGIRKQRIPRIRGRNIMGEKGMLESIARRRYYEGARSIVRGGQTRSWTSVGAFNDSYGGRAELDLYKEIRRMRLHEPKPGKELTQSQVTDNAARLKQLEYWIRQLYEKNESALQKLKR